MNAMKQPAGEDPEMVQLSAMMNKIIAIQNPGLVSRCHLDCCKKGG